MNCKHKDVCTIYKAYKDTGYACDEKHCNLKPHFARYKRQIKPYRMCAHDARFTSVEMCSYSCHDTQEEAHACAKGGFGRFDIWHWNGQKWDMVEEVASW